ncbi:12727_t:CDS:2 [Entrophospora sp. SA101]|nr:12727_t:CDS:2 [Entrophospora sp. SA101]
MDNYWCQVAEKFTFHGKDLQELKDEMKWTCRLYVSFLNEDHKTCLLDIFYAIKLNIIIKLDEDILAHDWLR